MKYCISVCIILLFSYSDLFGTEMEEEADIFIQEHVQKIMPLYKAMNLTYWAATAHGNQEFYQKAAEMELEMRKVYTNRDDFIKVKRLKEGNIQNVLLKRQIELLYIEYLRSQIDAKLMEELIKASSAIEAKFNTHRAEFEGQKIPDNAVVEILRKETDITRRRAAWEACKTVGEKVAPELIELVKLRNKAARELGFANYYEMNLVLAEQNLEDVKRIFDELAVVTQEPFTKIKTMVDTTLAARYGIKVEEMRPYHYQDFFFQELPELGDIDMDVYIKDKDVKQIAVKFYNDMDLQVAQIIKNSDLYERENKYQHAYCTDIDHDGDVRIMCSLRNNRYWLETMLHELGHGVYDLYIDPKLPWLLREPSHIFTTEAIAQMFEGVTSNPLWLKEILGVPQEQLDNWTNLKLQKKMGSLIFCRWSLVMVNFERELYRDPDQDLNKLWWDYVEKYQFVKRVENRNKPDWAAKIHLATVPVYYHNYMLGNLMVSQIVNHMAKKILHEQNSEKVTFIRQPEVAKYLKEQIFAPGKRLRWDTLIFNATGEPLNPKYFVEDVSVR